MEPMLDRADSALVGGAVLDTIEAQLAAGDNVVLLSNHQTEADPSCWSFILDGDREPLARKMIMVAGDRVTADVVRNRVQRHFNMPRTAVSGSETLTISRSRAEQESVKIRADVRRIEALKVAKNHSF